MRRLRVVDSHTEGEPTRVVLDNPGIPMAPMSDRVAWLREHDEIRRGIVLEPRGSDVLVGAFLLDPHAEGADAAVIFFNNAGLLGMCGHGTIGLVRTLEHLGRDPIGGVRLETPAGTVRAARRDDGLVEVENVASFRYRKDVEVDLGPDGAIHGDIAYGGNWFFLSSDHGQSISSDNTDHLTRFSAKILRCLSEQGMTGEGGAPIDHVELFALPQRSDADSKNFVLCPGLAYDRSPCGTGTSAKLACLAADGKLSPDQKWRQESIIGSLFEGHFRSAAAGKILPYIAGRAYVTGETSLLFEDNDPFADGIALEMSGGGVTAD